MDHSTAYCCMRSLHESDLSALADLMREDGDQKLKKLMGFVPTSEDLRRQTFDDPDYTPHLTPVS